MFDAMQESVDRLALTLHRSVQLDDASFHLLACSAHFDDVDAARIHALTARDPDPRQLEHLRAQRFNAHHAPVLMPAAPDLGYEWDRLCVPLRSRFEVLGHLWIIQRVPLSDAELAVVAEVAETVEHILYAMSQSIAAVNAEIETETLNLLAPEPAMRAAASQELRDLGMFQRSRHYVALCLSLPIDWTPWSGPPPRDMIFRVLWRAISAPMIDSYSFVATTPDTFIVIGYRNAPTRDALDAMGTAIMREIRSLELDVDGRARVGIGAPVDDVAEVWTSYEQALVAVRVARVTGESTTFWADHPVHAAAAVLLAPPAADHLLPELVRRLAASPPEVVELFDAYFRHGNNVAEVAHALNVHRATVYYRLRKAAEHIGLDLEDGDARFVVQAWLHQQRAPGAATDVAISG